MRYISTDIDGHDYSEIWDRWYIAMMRERRVVYELGWSTSVRSDRLETRCMVQRTPPVLLLLHTWTSILEISEINIKTILYYNHIHAMNCVQIIFVNRNCKNPTWTKYVQVIFYLIYSYILCVFTGTDSKNKIMMLF